MTSGDQTQVSKNDKKYAKMKGYSLKSMGNTKKSIEQDHMLADRVFGSQMNSISQYQKKIIQRQRRIISIEVNDDKSFQRMQQMANPFQLRQAGANNHLRDSSKLTGSLNQTRETQIHENIIKEIQYSHQDDRIETSQNINNSRVIKEKRDQFQTIDMSDLPRIQTPILSVGQGQSSSNLDLDDKRFFPSSMHTGFYGQDPSFKNTYNQTLIASPSGDYLSNQNKLFSQSIVPTHSGQVLAYQKNQSDYKESTILLGSFGNSNNLKFETSKNQEKLNQMLKSTLRHKSIGNQGQISSNSSQKVLSSNRPASKHHKKKRTIQSKGLQIDMYNNKLINYKDQVKFFPNQFLETKHSVLHKDQSVGNSESIQHNSWVQQATGRHMPTDQTQSDDPMLQFYPKDQIFRGNHLLIPKFTQQMRSNETALSQFMQPFANDQTFNQQIVQNGQNQIFLPVQDGTQNQTGEFCQSSPQNDNNQTLQMAQVFVNESDPADVVNLDKSPRESNNYYMQMNNGQVDSGSAGMKLPTEFQALIDKQREIEKNQDKVKLISHSGLSKPSGLSSRDKDKVDDEAENEKKIMMRFSMGQGSVEPPDSPGSNPSKSEPGVVAISQDNQDSKSKPIKDVQLSVTTPHETEVKIISRLSSQAGSPVSKAVHGVDILVGEVSGFGQQQISHTLSNQANTSLPTQIKDNDASSKQIVIHKSATSIALGNRDQVIKPGRSLYEGSRERRREIKNGALNLCLNDDDEEIQTFKVGSSHTASKTENYKVRVSHQNSQQPPFKPMSKLQMQREVQQKELLNMYQTEDRRDGSTSERQVKTNVSGVIQKSDQVSKRLTTNEGTVSSIPLKMAPLSKPQDEGKSRNIIDAASDATLAKKSLNQNVSTDKAKLDEGSQVEQVEQNPQQDQNEQLIQEIENIEETFSLEPYDLLQAQERSEVRYHKQFRGSRLISNKKNAFQHVPAVASSQQNYQKMAESTLNPNGRQINVLNAGNAGFFQRVNKARAQSGYNLNQSNKFMLDKQKQKRRSIKKYVFPSRGSSTATIQMTKKAKNEINNLNLGYMLKDDEQKLRETMLRKDISQSKGSLLAKSQRARYQVNLRDVAGPINLGSKPVQKELAIDYVKRQPVNEKHQYCGHEFNYKIQPESKNNADGDKRPKQPLKPRSRSKSPKKAGLSGDSSPKSAKIRSTLRNRKSREKSNGKSYSPSNPDKELIMDARTHNQDKNNELNIQTQNPQHLRLIEVGSQSATNSPRSPGMGQIENSRADSDESNISPLMLKNARMKGFGQKQNDVSSSKNIQAGPSFDTKKENKELKLDIKKMKQKTTAVRQSQNIDDIIREVPPIMNQQERESIVQQTNFSPQESFSLAVSRNQVTQKKSTGEALSMKNSTSRPGAHHQLGTLQDSNRQIQINSVRSSQRKQINKETSPIQSTNPSKKASIRTGHQQVYKLSQPNNMEARMVDGSHEGSRQQTSHHLKIKIGSDQEFQEFHTTTQHVVMRQSSQKEINTMTNAQNFVIPSLFAAVQSKSGDTGGVRTSEDMGNMGTHVSQQVFNQDRKFLIQQLMNASNKNFMQLPVQNLVFTGENDQMAIKQDKNAMMIQMRNIKQDLRQSWKQRLIRNFTPPTDRYSDMYQQSTFKYQDYQLLKPNHFPRGKSENRQGQSFNSRNNQVDQNASNLIDLVRGPLEIDPKQIKINKQNENFDKIARETKDKTLLRLAIQRKKSQKPKTQINQDLIGVQTQSMQFPVNASSIAESAGTKHSVIIIQLGDTRQGTNLGQLEGSGPYPTLHATVNEEIGEQPAMSQDTPKLISGQISPSIINGTKPSCVEKKNSSMVSGSWALPGSAIPENQQQWAALPQNNGHFSLAFAQNLDINQMNMTNSGNIANNGTMVNMSRTMGPISTDSPKLIAIGNAFKGNQFFSNFDLDSSGQQVGHPGKKRGSIGTVDSRKKSTGRGNISGRNKNTTSNKTPSQNIRSEQNLQEPDNHYNHPTNLDYQSSQARLHSNPHMGPSPGYKKLNDDIEFDEPVYIVSKHEDQLLEDQNAQELQDALRDTVSNIEVDEPTTITVQAVQSGMQTAVDSHRK